MENKDGHAPCGNFVDDCRHEPWRQEMSCCMIGCSRCGLYKGGKEYYEVSDENMKRGIVIWAKYKLGYYEDEEKDNDSETANS